MKLHQAKTGKTGREAPVPSGKESLNPVVVLEKVSRSYFNGAIEVKALSEVSLEIDLPPRKESSYNIILKGQKGGTNGQEKSIIKNR